MTTSLELVVNCPECGSDDVSSSQYSWDDILSLGDELIKELPGDVTIERLRVVYQRLENNVWNVCYGCLIEWSDIVA